MLVSPLSMHCSMPLIQCIHFLARCIYFLSDYPNLTSRRCSFPEMVSYAMQTNNIECPQRLLYGLTKTFSTRPI
jgi:hypothetical protein